jgi:hypothetical protein
MNNKMNEKKTYAKIVGNKVAVFPGSRTAAPR